MKPKNKNINLKQKLLSAFGITLWINRRKRITETHNETFLKQAHDANQTPERIDKTLAAIKAAWLQSPHAPLGHVLSWIASDDPRKRGNHRVPMDYSLQTGVYALWDVNDKELRELATKWKNRQQSRPRRKKPYGKFPRVKSIDP